MAIGSLPPVINEIQANSGQPGKTLAQQTTAHSLLDVQAAATAEPATAIVPETTLIEKAVADALGRQGGLASLYATLLELADAPDLPDAVKAAVNRVLAFRMGEGEATPERVAQAIRASGLFHEAVAAGKMAAMLPPAVRQALGGTPEEKRLVTARPGIPASQPTPSAATAVTSPPSPSPKPNASGLVDGDSPASPVPLSARQAGLPTAAAATAAPQAGGIASATPTPGANQPSPNAPGLAATSAASPIASATGTAAQSTGADVLSGAAAAIPGQSVVIEDPSFTPAKTIPGSGASSSAAAEGRGNAPPSALGQMSAPEGAGTVTMPKAAGQSAPTNALSPVPPAAPVAIPEEGAASGQSASLPSPSARPTASSTTSDLSEAGTRVQSTPTASSSAVAGTSTQSRSFAPWTPGRPLAPAVPPTKPEMPATASSSGSGPAVSSPPVVSPTGGEMAAGRSTGDKAPFVPSIMESLPTTSSELAAKRTALTGAPPSPLATNVAQPAGSASTPASSLSQPQAGLVVGAGVPSPSTQPATPQAPPAVSGGTQIPPDASIGKALLQASAPSTTALAAVGVDLKGALEMLRRELVTWLGRNADVMASLAGGDDDTPASRVDRPPPPRKNGPVRGQPAMPLVGGDDAESASAETLAGRALGEAERSLSRVFLHQAATAESRDTKVAQSTQAFICEIPIAGPGGTSIAQLRIERDDHAPTEPGSPPRRVFQVDIAFDIVPLGPVAVRVGLMDGRRVAVGVWCETDDGLVRMEAERENIVLGLEQEGMVVAGVDLHHGHPPEGRDEMTVAASHRLDLQL